MSVGSLLVQLLNIYEDEMKRVLRLCDGCHLSWKLSSLSQKKLWNQFTLFKLERKKRDAYTNVDD
jgi:hypothetical protein